MNIEKIKKIELEITSGCNAACPGCARTQNLDILNVQSFTLDDLKRIFPSADEIIDRKFKFCGVLGDPAFNLECVDMVEYLALRGGWCQLSTNGAIQNADWWYKLGQLSYETGNIDVSFCVDGHKETNHVYRVNTVWNVLERNLQAYVDGGKGKAQATWIFIVFDHNEHELNVAREHAARLGIKFATRTGMRNSYHNWVAQIKKKDLAQNKVVTEQKIITTTGAKEHSKKDQIKELDQFIKSYSKKENIDKSKKDAIVNSISCKYVHEGEIFISSDQRVWPCCFLWDSYFKNKESIVDKLESFGSNWNSLKHFSLKEILDHEWYQTLLELSWDLDHNLHFKRCIRTCALNKAYQNEIYYDK
jgi:MoaA/NifB/PqqE/SkfB family radical SAM enzyme